MTDGANGAGGDPILEAVQVTKAFGGLVAVESPAAVDAISDGDEVWVDYHAGVVTLGAQQFAFAPYPQILRDILESGGLIEHLMSRAQEGGGPK